MQINPNAIIFPGQGSQQVGMLADIAAQYPEVEAVFAQASDVLQYDLWQLTQSGSAAELAQTEKTQPALLAAGYAVWKILQSRIDMQSVHLAGHSLGEYTALACANAFTFPDAIKLVAARGAYMQEAVPADVGAMAAIVGLSDEQVADICQTATTANEIVSPANFNSIGQVVIAGNKNAVDEAIALAKEQGARMAVPLPVSVPSHCALMLPAAEKLAIILANTSIQAPDKKIINNVDVKAYTTPESIRDGLVRQLSHPVRWVETMQFFVSQHITTIIECGPGKVLTGLNKRIDKSFNLFSTDDLTNLEKLIKN